MSWKKLLPPFLYRRGVTPGKPLIDGEYIEESVEKSPASIVLILVFVWIAAAVMLTLSDTSQRDLTVFAENQKAPFSVWARCDFSYEDSTGTAAARKAARDKAPLIYRINPEKQELVNQELARFFSALQLRAQSEAEKKVFIPGENTGSKLAANLIEFQNIYKAVRKNGKELENTIVPMLRHGIAGKKLNLPERQKTVHVVSVDGRHYNIYPQTAAECAGKLADVLQLTGNPRQEFTRTIEQILSPGTIIFDKSGTNQAQQSAAAAVKPVIKTKKDGDLLVERGKNISAESVDMLAAERQALPAGFGVGRFYLQAILCFLVMAVALFFLYRTYPQVFSSTRRLALEGGVIVLALLANFGALQLFLYFFRTGVMPEYDLMLFMVPIPLGAALMSALLGNRSAMFSGFLVTSLTALMILPDRSFELALRWFAISSLTGMLVRNVRNYRSFFVRVLFGSMILSAVINSDVLISLGDIRLLKIAGIAICGNAFICSVCSLLLVFAFELIFNTDTNMSLMMLCDYSHPLLEKLKREAPGTMFHSMTVATLAEDAAAAIHADPLRAKAGALFHDIGKLSMPQYFVENNVDSPKDHEAMPPQRSCGIIRGHVKEGLALARSYRLCSFLRDAITTHHGDDLISFFYRRALAEQSENSAGMPPVLEAQFRYDGPPPTGKELTIISLADACEAASRSLNKPSPAKVENLVNEIFIGRMRGGQLRNSELTLEELNTVRECFIADLINSNHGRIAYSQEKKDDTTALPVAESPASGTEKK